MTHTKAELYEKFQSLPEEIQEAFLSIDTLTALEKITSKFNLHVDQAGEMSELVGHVMLGTIKPNQLLTELESKLSIPLETAGEIVKEINALIFFPIRSALEKAHHEEKNNPYQPAPSPKVEHFSPAGNVSSHNIPRSEPPLRVPNNNAIIVENSDQKNSDRNLFEEKMSKLFRLPKEEFEISSGQKKEDDSQKINDPYREPIQ